MILFLSRIIRTYKKKSSENPQRDYWIMLFVLLFACGVFYYFEWKREDELQKVGYSFGIIEHKTAFRRSKRTINIMYDLQGKTVHSSRVRVGTSCFKKLEIGDTVLIKYSLKNRETVELESCRWDEDARSKLEKFNKKK